jgi:hypothetical protein
MKFPFPDLGELSMSSSLHIYAASLDHAHPPPHTFQSLPSSTCIRSASDGSVLHSLGYQGWLTATLDNDILLEGFGATDGRVKDTQS